MKSFLSILSALLCFVVGSTNAAPSLSDGQIKELLSGHLAGLCHSVHAGKFDVTNRDDPNNGRISRSTYEQYLQLKQLGVLSISHDKRYEDYKKGGRGSFTWDQWLDQADGTVAKITVYLTPRAKEIAKPGASGSYACLKEGAVSSVSVKKNEPRQIGADDYRVVVATFRKEWTPELFKLFGKDYGSEMKILALFRHDPASGKWQMVESDLGSQSGEYASDDVNRILRGK